MKLIAGIQSYNACQTLERCLESLTDFDLILVADGSFDTDKLSTDGTREICNKYENVKLLNMPNSNTAQKKNKIQSFATHPQDILIHIDADCYLVGDVSKLKQRLGKPFKTTLAIIPVYMKCWQRHNARHSGKVIYRAWVLNPYNVKTPNDDHGKYVKHGRVLFPSERLNYVAIIHDDSVRKIDPTYIDALTASDSKEAETREKYQYSLRDKIRHRICDYKCKKQKELTKDDILKL